MSEVEPPMRVGSLCSGMGGLDLALDHEVAWHCENDVGASRILEHHWPGVPNHGDVREIDWEEIGVMGAPRNDALAEMMYDLYCQGLSIEQVARRSGRSRQTVHKMFQRRGFDLRPRSGPPRAGVLYGGRAYTMGDPGYLRCTTGDRHLLHRKVWEDTYGPIPPGYDVHHLDHNKLNNDIENLRLLTKADHARLHATGVVPIDSPTVDIVTAGFP